MYFSLDRDVSDVSISIATQQSSMSSGLKEKFSFYYNYYIFRCEEMSEVYDQLDLILDVQCLSFEAVDTFKVAVILAHNVVVLFQSWNLLRIVLPSSVNCILYQKIKCGISTHS